MLVRNLFGKGKRINKCGGRRKTFEGKGERSNTQNKEKIILYYIKNNIKLNNITFNLVCYNNE
jgi:hypothetical protein